MTQDTTEPTKSAKPIADQIQHGLDTAHLGKTRAAEVDTSKVGWHSDAVPDVKGFDLYKSEPHPRKYKTVAEGLSACTSEFRGDLFWGEFGLPTDEGRKKLLESEEVDDPSEALELRKQVYSSLEVALEQLGKIDYKGLFIAETAIISIAFDTLKLKGTTSESPIADAGSKEYMVLRRSLLKQEALELATRQAAAAAEREQLLKRKLPFGPPAKIFDWHQKEWELTMSVTMVVPPYTEKQGVKLTIDEDMLQLHVPDHPMQPYVLDGYFPYDIDPSATTWHLEGDGAHEERKLVISLDKADYADWSPHGLFIKPDEEGLVADTAAATEAVPGDVPSFD